MASKKTVNRGAFIARVGVGDGATFKSSSEYFDALEEKYPFDEWNVVDRQVQVAGDANYYFIYHVERK